MGILKALGCGREIVSAHFSKSNDCPVATVANNSGLPRVLFVGCIAFYCIYLLAMQPAWVLGGQMWAEMATNYFVHASGDSLLERLFAIDAGYIPLPQRLMAMLGAELRLPPQAVPYFYTWTAILATGGLVGAFCLRPFRGVIRNDYLRFSVAIAVLMTADFETRTFINFTYFAAFLVAIICALALADREREVPSWAWIVPPLMLSKPALLAALPVMICVGLVSHKRFRLIVLASFLVCMLQIVQMVLSHAGGTFEVVTQESMVTKIATTLRYFSGFTAGFGIGRDTGLSASALRWLGLLAIAVLILVVLFRSTRSRALIVVGLSLVLFNMALNAFALSQNWNSNMSMINGVPLYRHVIVAFFGVTLSIAALIDSEIEYRLGVDTAIGCIAGPLLFVAWFCLAGWFGVSGNINKMPSFPVTQSSSWQQMSEPIASGKSACVPVDPLGWFYLRNCALISANIDWSKPFQFHAVAQGEPIPGVGARIELQAPAVQASRLLGIALPVRPAAAFRVPVRASAILHTRDGKRYALAGERDIDAGGGLLVLLVGQAIEVSYAEITSITVDFDKPVDLAFVPSGDSTELGAIWLGN